MISLHLILVILWAIYIFMNLVIFIAYVDDLIKVWIKPENARHAANALLMMVFSCLWMALWRMVI